MSVGIRVSYEDTDELTAVYELLKPLHPKLKLQPPKGRYKRAYIMLKSIPTKPANPEHTSENA